MEADADANIIGGSVRGSHADADFEDDAVGMTDGYGVGVRVGLNATIRTGFIDFNIYL